MPLDIDDLGNLMHGDDESDDDNGEDTLGVDVVGLRNDNDIIDVTGLDCPVCYEQFKDKDEIVMFGCSFSHFLCLSCARQWNIRDVCHMCRAPVTTLQIFKGHTFIKGEGTTEDPIVID